MVRLVRLLGVFLYFAPIFFPSSDPTAELLGAAAVFAVGFLMRHSRIVED